MITTLMQSVGLVFTIVIIAAIGLITMYLSYIIGIGFIVVTAISVVYYILSIMKSHK